MNCCHMRCYFQIQFQCPQSMYCTTIDLTPSSSLVCSCIEKTLRRQQLQTLAEKIISCGPTQVYIQAYRSQPCTHSIFDRRCNSIIPELFFSYWQTYYSQRNSRILCGGYYAVEMMLFCDNQGERL